MYSAGEKPGQGPYKCTACEKVIHLDQDSDVLLPCPKCHKSTYVKLYCLKILIA